MSVTGHASQCDMVKTSLHINEWRNNNQAVAYAIIATEQLGYTTEQIEKVQAGMLAEIDWTDEETDEMRAGSILRG